MPGINWDMSCDYLITSHVVIKHHYYVYVYVHVFED